jgi:hypothetical protein
MLSSFFFFSLLLQSLPYAISKQATETETLKILEFAYLRT